MDTNDLENYSSEQIWAHLSESENEEKVDLLLELYDRCMKMEDFIQAASIAEQAASEAEKCMGNITVENAFYKQGFALWKEDRNLEAIQAFTRGVNTYQEPDSKVELSKNQWGIAVAYFDEGNFLEAASWANLSSDSAVSSEAFSMAGLSKFVEGKSLHSAGKSDEALKMCELARNYRRAEYELDRVAEIDGYMASIHSSNGNHYEAINLLRNCLVLAEATDSVEIKYFSYRLGNSLLDFAYHDEARTHLERARAGYQEIDDHGSVAECCFSLSLTYRGNDMLDHAIDLARTATSLWDATGNDTSYLRGLQRVAILLAAKEDYGSAIDNNNRIIDFISSKGGESYQIQLGWAQLRNATCYQNSYMWEFSLMKLEETKLFGPSSSHMGNTWYYSLKALALYELDRHEEALGVADTGLSLTGNDDVDEDTAVLYEIKARVSLEQDRPDKERHLAHAIALLLAFGKTEKARELSDYFKPDFSPQVRDSILSGDSVEQSRDTGGEQLPRIGVVASE
jgi:tetratricopeptide (TPR) repeat protein